MALVFTSASVGDWDVLGKTVITNTSAASVDTATVLNVDLLIICKAD